MCADIRWRIDRVEVAERRAHVQKSGSQLFCLGKRGAHHRGPSLFQAADMIRTFGSHATANFLLYHKGTARLEGFAA